MDVLRQVLAVGLVLALMGAALWALRRRGLAAWSAGRRRGASRRIALLERVTLSPQHTLHLVRVADRVLLLAAHPAGCAVLDTLAWRDLEQPAEVVR